MDAVAKRFQNLRSNVVTRVREFMGNHELLDEQSVINASGESSSQERGQGGYTELIGGSVPCPSCNGSGMIPKELESTLVALIPLNDDRLKPKRLWKYILFWVFICVIIGGSVIFILMPRTVTLVPYMSPISVVNVTKTDPMGLFIDFDFWNRVNVSSGNYLPVSIVNVSATIVSKFQPWSVDVVGYGFNNTIAETSRLSLFGRSVTEVYFNNSVALKGYVAEYCQAPFSKLTALYVTMQFDIFVTLEYYYGHQEQISITATQQVCCIPSGNCTAAAVI